MSKPAKENLTLFDKVQCKDCACTICELTPEQCIHNYAYPCERCEIKMNRGEISAEERKPLLMCIEFNGKGKVKFGIVPDDWKEV